jgi:transcriptional regulator with AAA-type ATPase domain
MDNKIALWLKEHSYLDILDEETLIDLSFLLEDFYLPSQQNLVEKGTIAAGLYILIEGRMEAQDGTISLLSGAVINLHELLLKQTVSFTILSLTDCKLWYVEREKFLSFLETHVNISQTFTQKLAQEVEALAYQLSFEQDRQSILRPFLVTKAKRGIVGKTSYATRLRAEILAASQNNEPVLIFGEPGLEKDNIAALIHFSSNRRQNPIVKVDCSSLQSNAVELFGRVGGKIGIIEALQEGTLILNNIQELSKELIPLIIQLIQEKTYSLINNDSEQNLGKKISQARIILISEKTLPILDNQIKSVIKVPPLRVRKADINYQVNYYLSIICNRKSLKKLEITPEVLRRLQSYDFPNNIRELENLLERAITQLSGDCIITEEIIWPSQGKKKQFRLNLLNLYPMLRKLLHSSWYPDKINYGFTSIVFALILLILFLGPQKRAENFALNIFWSWWWPLSLIAFPFLGRIWCAFCPFMIYGEIAQKISLYLYPRELKKWPRLAAEKWGSWFLFGLFSLILLWEELWNLPDTAYLSACLLLLITAGAVIFSLIFERRIWCRYLCPIGGMNGMFAKLSITELRAQQGTCSAECTTYQCYKGGPAKGEGLETNGCPLYSHPAQLNDNRDCVLCMTCLKACPHRSVELNLRPPAIELWSTHLPREAEVALMMLLLNGVFLHYLPNIFPHIDLSDFWIHFVLSVVILIVPALLLVLATFLVCREKKSWLNLIYGYLPIVLAANLAHYLNLGLTEAGRIIPVAFATFGFLKLELPIWVAHPAVITFLQGVVLITGFLSTIVLSSKISKQTQQKLLPQHMGSLIMTILLWFVIL